jgi:hypothetical protein
MPSFNPRELHGLEKLTATPEKLHTQLTRLVLSSKKVSSKVELCNEKTGEYCIKLEGTLGPTREEPVRK